MKLINIKVRLCTNQNKDEFFMQYRHNGIYYSQKIDLITFNFIKSNKIKIK